MPAAQGCCLGSGFLWISPSLGKACWFLFQKCLPSGGLFLHSFNQPWRQGGQPHLVVTAEAQSGDMSLWSDPGRSRRSLPPPPDSRLSV